MAPGRTQRGRTGWMWMKKDDRGRLMDVRERDVQSEGVRSGLRGSGVGF